MYQYGLAHNTYPTLKPRQLFHTKTKICRTSGHTHKPSVFFFLHVAIRNSLRSNKSSNTFVPDTRYSSDLSPLSEKLYQVWAFIRPHSQMIYIMYVFRFFLECELYGLNELRRGSRRLSRTCIHTYQVHTYTHRWTTRGELCELRYYSTGS